MNSRGSEGGDLGGVGAGDGRGGNDVKTVLTYEIIKNLKFKFKRTLNSPCGLSSFLSFSSPQFNL